jgi:hypothetical protein
LWNLSSVAGFGSPCFFESALDGNLVIGFKGVIDPESERGPSSNSAPRTTVIQANCGNYRLMTMTTFLSKALEILIT